MNNRFLSRRQMLRPPVVGSLHLRSITCYRVRRSICQSPLAPRPPHFPGKAKAVISIFCYGGVSQVDTFDPKPLLKQRQGEALTGKGRGGRLAGSPWRPDAVAVVVQEVRRRAAWTYPSCFRTSQRRWTTSR